MLFFFLVLEILISFLLISNSYLQVVNYIQSNYPEVYDVDKIQYFFTQKQFIFLRLWVVFLTCITLLLLYLNRRYKLLISLKLKNKIYDFNEIIKKIFLSLRIENKKEKIILVLICILILSNHIYLWVESPIRVDDVSSYVFCSHQGPLVSGLLYHEANNHIFFNIVASFFDKFNLKPEVVMIVPSCISWVLILFLVYGFVRSQAGFQAACIGLLLSGLMGSSTTYSVQGRGYMMMSLFLLIGFISVFIYTYKYRNNIYLYIFVLSSTLAIWTLLSSLIAVVPLLVFLWIKSIKSSKKEILATTLLLGILVTFIYMPVLLINGIERLDNPWVQGKGYVHFFSILQPAVLESIDYLFYIPSKGFLVLLALIALTSFLYYKKLIVKEWIFFFSVIMVGSFIFITAKNAFPPYRTWTYISFLLNITIAFTFGAFMKFLLNRETIFYSLLLSIVAFCLYPYLDNQYISDKYFFEEIMKKSKEISTPKKGIIMVDQKDILYYFLKLERIKEDNKFSVVYEKKDNQVYSVVLKYNDFFPVGIKQSDYLFVEKFYDCEIYRLKDKH